MQNKRVTPYCYSVGKSQTSTMLYHVLSSRYADVRVIQEDKPDRMRLLKNRAKRIGWWKVLGQVMFMVSVP